jgi:hypothetical protein
MQGTPAEKTPVCLYEDREECAIGLKLLVLSAEVHEPDWHFHAFLKNLPKADLDWLARRRNVVVRDDDFVSQGGWNIKPSLLLRLLSESQGPVMWCDSDIILASPISPAINEYSDEVFIATEEYCWGRNRGSRIRTQGWGFDDKRPLRHTVNSCLLRVGQHHVTLLKSWEALMQREDYRTAQAASFALRPPYMMSDQDVLTALLASPEFADVQLFLLRSGGHIAQCFQEDGYTAGSRILNSLLRRVPPLVHAQGGKPWKTGDRATWQQLSPYVEISRTYVRDAGLPDYWLEADSPGTRFIQGFFRHNPNLTGVLPAATRTLNRIWKRLAESARRKTSAHHDSPVCHKGIQP